MNLKSLFTITAVLTVIFGLGFLIIPDTLLNVYSLTTDEAGISIARFFGAVFTGIGLLTWFARDTGESDARDAIVLSMFIISIFGVGLSLYFTLTGLFNVIGWGEVVLFLLFTIGYGLHQFKR